MEAKFLPLREFFVIREQGQLLFHTRFANQSLNKLENSTDPLMTSGLIAAIFQFAQTIEHDTIDFIRMRQASFSFHKSKELIFVLSMDFETNPIHFETIMAEIERIFINSFPDANFDSIIELKDYQGFGDTLHTLLKPIQARAELIADVMWIIGVPEEKLVEWSLEELAQAVARKFLSQQIDELRRASQEGIEYVLDIAQGILHDIGLGVQFILEKQIIVNCNQCQLCYQHEEECFCRDFIEEFLGNIDLFDHEIVLKT